MGAASKRAGKQKWQLHHYLSGEANMAAYLWEEASGEHEGTGGPCGSVTSGHDCMEVNF